MSDNEMLSPIELQPRDGRVQPLLVVLQSVDDVEFLINNAKCLRRPTDHIILAEARFTLIQILQKSRR